MHISAYSCRSSSRNNKAEGDNQNNAVKSDNPSGWLPWQHLSLTFITVNTGHAHNIHMGTVGLSPELLWSLPRC